jgi:hypothetical protein
MKYAGYTKQERTLLVVVRILAIAFLLTSIIFAAAPDYILNYISDIGKVLFGWRAPAVNLGDQRFWLVLAVGFVATITYLCFLTQRNLIRHIGYLRPVIFSKFVTTVGFLVCLFASEAQFFYLIGAVIDGLLFLVLWWLYVMAVNSRP